MRELESSRNMLIGAGTAVLSAPVAAGLTALVWQFPIAVAGTAGGDPGAALAAILTMTMFMTLFSVGGGAVAVGLVGAVAGFLVRRGAASAAVVAGVAVGILAALVVAVADAYLLG